MDINQLSKIVKKKILDNKLIEKVEILDKSFMHKNHSSNQAGKYHLRLIIDSIELKKKNKVISNKLIYKILEEEMKLYIHSIQIVFN
tara:strand:- start:3213 stop:3473 length:261 start_codon:yes stop_codon:yes gene_type:complete